LTKISLGTGQASQEKRTKDHPGSDSKEAKLLSNATHYSPTDPDSRISTKPGKPRNLNFFGQLSVDTSHHVITGAGADFADKRDSQCLEKLCEQTLENLRENEITMHELLADTGYSITIFGTKRNQRLDTQLWSVYP
jgi:hypothetical protein